MAGATKLITTAIANPLSTIVSKATQYSSTGARSGFYEPKLRSRIGIGAFVVDQFERGDIGLRRRQMNNFDSNRTIHSDMINYVVLGKDDKLLKSVQDGTIIALLVRDPFRIGYEGVKTALAAAEGEQASARVIIELNANVSVNQRTRPRR
jgi:hypothetical protein